LSTPEVRDLVVKGATSLVADPVLVQLVEPVTRTAVASPAFTPTVRGTVADVHREVVTALGSGTSRAVTQDGDFVVIRLGPLAETLGERLEAEGVPAGAFLTGIDTAVPVTTTERFAVARAAYESVERAARWGPVALVVLLALGGLLLGNAAAAAARFGTVGMLGSLLVAAGVWPAMSMVGDRVADPATRTIVELALDALVAPLVRSALAAACVLVVLAVIGAAAGRQAAALARPPGRGGPVPETRAGRRSRGGPVPETRAGRRSRGGPVPETRAGRSLRGGPVPETRAGRSLRGGPVPDTRAARYSRVRARR
ncbi:MAG: hypothetical protein ACRCYX_14800, partial [Dermatophilaceae bacterium]